MATVATIWRPGISLEARCSAWSTPGGVLLQAVPTVNQASVPSASPQAGTAHSVAVDPTSNHAFVPLPANNVFPECLNGCVAVFGAPKSDHNGD